MVNFRSKIINPIKQRLFYIRNYKLGFSFIFLLPGFLREYLGENTFFRTLIKNNTLINIQKNNKGYTLLKAGKFNFKFPKRCFYEGDFFDIIYPHLHIQDPLIETLVYKNPFYESEGCYENFGVVLRKGDYVVDAGASVGMFSIVASDDIGADGRVFAFEPLKESADVLKENIKNNNCKNIIVESSLLGDAAKEVDFFFNPEENYNAASKKIRKQNDAVVVLPQITLDSYVMNGNVKKIDFIKADIEGAERDLLIGAEQTIKKFKPKIAIRTYHLPDDPQVLYDIIKRFVPEYKTVQHRKTLYAWI